MSFGLFSPSHSTSTITPSSASSLLPFFVSSLFRSSATRARRIPTW